MARNSESHNPSGSVPVDAHQNISSDVEAGILSIIEFRSPNHDRTRDISTYPRDISLDTLRWHPKVTAYRLIVIVLTFSFGLANAVVTYQGKAIYSVTLEWIFGVVVFLLFYAMDQYEQTELAPTWLFEKDYSSYVWTVLRRFSFPVPIYRNEEMDVSSSRNQIIPAINGYRILLTSSTLALGMTKAYLSYRGYSTSATSIDWVLGVIVALSLYWLGLYENSCTKTMPSLFHVDYGPRVQILIDVAHHPLVVVGIVSWVPVWMFGIFILWNKSPTTEATDHGFRLFFFAFRTVWSIGATAPILLGLRGLKSRLKSIASALIMVLYYMEIDIDWKPFQFLESLQLLSSVEMKRLAVKKWIKRGKKSVYIVVMFILPHVFGLLFCVMWTIIWPFCVHKLWLAAISGSGSLFRVVFLWIFTGVWSSGACAATYAGCVGCYMVIRPLCRREALRMGPNLNSWKTVSRYLR